MKIYLGNKGDTEIELNDDDVIQVRPLAKYTGGVWNIKYRQAFRVEVYDGFVKSQQYIYYKEKTRYDSCIRFDTIEEAKKAADEYYKANNKVWKDTTLELKVKDLNEHIMAAYRFIQPSIDYPYQDVPLDPMFLGLWLGDGTSRTASITNIDEELIEYTKQIATKFNLRVKSDKRGMTHRICTERGKFGGNEVLNILRQQDLILNKHIPECYMKNCTQVRLQVLAGLIDTDGYLCSNTYEITQKSNRLAKDIVDLAMSVGIYAENREKIAYAANTVEKTRYKYNRIFLHVPTMDLAPPVLLSRKDYQKPVVNYGIQMSLTRNDNFRHDWTPEKKLELFKVASNYIDSGGRIQWKVIVENEPAYATHTPQSLRVLHKEYIKTIDETIHYE